MGWQHRVIRNNQAFIASTDALELTPNIYVDKLTLSWKVEYTAASVVTVAAALDLINPVDIRTRQGIVNLIRGTDLYALNQLGFGKNPWAQVGNADTDDMTQIMGINLFLWQPPRPRGGITVTANRAAVGGADTETITIEEIANTVPLAPRWLHYVARSITPTATGEGTIINLAEVGDLQGILFFSTQIPDEDDQTASLQSLKMFLDGNQVVERTFQGLKADAKNGYHDLGSSPGDWSILDNYIWLSFAKQPIPQGTKLKIDINAGAASAIRAVPVYTVLG